MWLEIQRDTGRVSYDTEVYHPLKYMKFKSSASLSTSVYEFKNEVWYLVTADASLKNLKCSLFGLASPGQMVEVLWSQQEKICMLYTFCSESIRPTVLLSCPQHGARMWTDSQFLLSDMLFQFWNWDLTCSKKKYEVNCDFAGDDETQAHPMHFRQVGVFTLSPSWCC